MTNRFVLIMAGGVGSRFWPASREDRPKQFLDILGTGKSLLRLTFERSLELVPASHIFVVTNAMYAGQVAEHLPELEEEQIFLEPSRNNTAPCIAFASLKLKKRFGEGVCLVAPADHIIADQGTFVEKAELAMAFAAEHDALVTMGMTPTRPDTGYGYIQFNQEAQRPGVHGVKRFTEKPGMETAREFLASGDYLWNSGMFVWSLRSVLRSFQQNARNTYDLLKEGYDTYFTDSESAFLAKNYPLTEKTSVDYAIMEKAGNVFVVPADFGWSDLGTWASLYEQLDHDPSGNVILNGDVHADDCRNTLIRSQKDKLVVASGLEDYVVICDDDVVLIFPRAKEQQVKEIRKELESKGLKRYL